MPLINRIEVSNFINLDRNGPWKPKWPHAVFDLLGFNSVINMPNGSGKTAIVSTALCSLAGAGRHMSKLRDIFFAPKSFGTYTHVRLQITLDTEEGVGFDLFSGAPQGLQKVFGVYGRSGDDERHHFYSYDGTFEDCPVNRSDPGKHYKKHLISDKEFEDCLAAMPNRFPANTREATDTAWRAYIQKWGFDLASIEQQLAYQLNAGAEGKSSYFEVQTPQNMSYSAGVFYKHLAPQLLTDVMGGHGEEDEKGIEDTIHEKAMRVVHAQMQCDRQKEHLDKAEHMLAAIERIRDVADEMATTEADISACKEKLGLELAVLKNITVDNPIPGLPPRLPDGLPPVAEYLVLSGGTPFLPDRAFALFTGEEPRIINERARRKGVDSAEVEKSQLIEIACDLDFSTLDRKHTGGQANKFYDQESVLSLLTQTDNFPSGLTREAAIADVEAAFAWANVHADTNPARILRNELEKERTGKRNELGQVFTTLKNFGDEKVKLLNEREKVGVQLAEYIRMRNSGLFSVEELSCPEKTGNQTGKDETEAAAALSNHRHHVARNESLFAKWREFVADYGVGTEPASVLEDLLAKEISAKEALTPLQSTRSLLIENRQRLKSSTAVARKDADAYAKRLDLAEETLPLHERFEAIFPGEDPRGLAQKVTSELSAVHNELKKTELGLAGIVEGLAAVSEFREKFGESTDPSTWLEKRQVLYKEKQTLKDSFDRNLDELRINFSDLEQSSVAPGQHARAVAAGVGVPFTYLHEFVENIGLPFDMKRQALTLFSALLFAPVVSDMDQAVTAARNLAEKKLEFPVFIADDLSAVCRSEDISGNMDAVRRLFVGVRTRNVDCLLDPGLVEREKRDILEKIESYEQRSSELRIELANLSYDDPDSRLAARARDAMEKNVLEKEARWIAEGDEIRRRIPKLEERAAASSVEAINGAIKHRDALADDLLADLRQTVSEKNEVLQLAEIAENDNEAEIRQVDGEISLAEEAYQSARLDRASREPVLKEISSFASDPEHGPDFMKTADETTARLQENLEAARARNDFNFSLAQEALRTGLQRPEEISSRIDEIDETVPKLEAEKSQLETEIEALRERVDSYSENVVKIDLIAAKLAKTYRKHRSDSIGQYVDLSRNDLYKACSYLRSADSAENIIYRIIKLQPEIETVEEEIIKRYRKLKDTEEEHSRAVKRFDQEFNLVRNDRTLRMTEHFGYLLDQAKDRPSEIGSLLAKTRSNYDKERTANNEALQQLEYEWEKIGEWLTQFTQRLPTFFDLMKHTFAPKRDQNRKLVQAGFEIKGEMISMEDVKGVLEEIVKEVTHYEEQDEESRKDNEKTFRQKIREKFYQRVILGPSIKVCIPELGDKLELKKEMASSGQMVAISLLWIVKLADFVTERERSRRRIKAAVEGARNLSMKKLRGMESQFVFVDGAFSHLSDEKLINSVLEGISRTRGNFQLVVTMHNTEYKHSYKHFPTLLSGRKIGERYMYVLRSAPVEPGTMGSHYGAMDVLRVHCIEGNKSEGNNHGPAANRNEGQRGFLDATGEEGISAAEGSDQTAGTDSLP